MKRLLVLLGLRKHTHKFVKNLSTLKKAGMINNIQVYQVVTTCKCGKEMNILITKKINFK
jgi:hypothetical protein